MQGNGKVFISYSRKDADLVARLREDLKRAGVDIWLDREQLKSYTLDWQESVRKDIVQATMVIYAASPDAADSKYVGHELAIARDEDKRILPFWIRGEKWSRCMPMDYYYAQYTDGRGADYAKGLEKLLAALEAADTSSAPPIASFNADWIWR